MPTISKEPLGMMLNRAFVLSAAAVAAILMIVVALRGALAAGFVPSDPVPPTIGIRILSDGSPEVKIPVCRGVAISEVDATLYDRIDKQPENPNWTRSGFSSDSGEMILGGNSGPGAIKGRLPDVRKFQYLYIGYSEGTGGSGAVIDLRAVLTAGSTADRYWTAQGPMTAGQIDGAGNC